MTIKAFRHFCMKAPGMIGVAVLDYFDEIASTAAVSDPEESLPDLLPVAVASDPDQFDEQRKLELKPFFEAIRDSEEQYPVNFDDVWHICGYSRKDVAKRALKGPGIDGEILLQVSRRPAEKSINNITPQKGRPAETILMTVRGFKHFCLMAPGERGAQIRDYFISLEEIAHAALQVADAVSRGDIAAQA